MRRDNVTGVDMYVWIWSNISNRAILALAKAMFVVLDCNVVHST
jgi:hypothetical protein